MTLEQVHQIENSEDIQDDIDTLKNALNKSGDVNLNNKDFAAKVGNKLNSEKDRDDILEKGEKNITELKKIGIYINTHDEAEIKKIKLTEEEIKNIDIIQNTLGITIRGRDIIEDIFQKEKPLDINEIKNIQKIQQIFKTIYLHEIKYIRGIDIEENGIKDKIGQIRRLGIDMEAKDIQKITDLKLDENAIKKITIIKNLGNERNKIKINMGNIKEIINMEELNENEIKTINKVLELNINVHVYEIQKIRDIKIDPEQEKNIVRIKSLQKEIGIKDLKLFIEMNEDEVEILETNNEKLNQGYTIDEIETYNYYKKGKLIEEIHDYVEEKIEKKEEVTVKDIINKVKSDLINIPLEEKINIIKGIHSSVKKINTIKTYIDFERNGARYKTPKELLCAIRGINDQKLLEKITDDITVRQNGVGMMFFVKDKDSFNTLIKKEFIEGADKPISLGFATKESEIPELIGTLQITYGNDPENDKERDEYKTLIHEGQHTRNYNFMPKNIQPINDAKDEIIAYLREGQSLDITKNYLTTPESKGGIYQYGLEGEDWENHKKEVEKLITYVKDLIELTTKDYGLTMDNIISTLSGAPVKKREQIHNNIIKRVMLDEIKKCKDTNNIISILNNQIYKNITLEPQNIGCIEISAIIRQIEEENDISKKQEYIKELPEEIGQIISKLIE